MEKLIKDLTDRGITFGYDNKGFLTFPSTQKGGAKRPYYLWNEDFFEEIYGEDIAKRVKQQTKKNPFLKSEVKQGTRVGREKLRVQIPTVEKGRYFSKKNVKSKKVVKKIGGMPEPQKNLIKLAKKGKQKVIQSQKQRFRTGLEKLQEEYGLTPDDYDEYTPAVMRRRESEMLWNTIPGLR